MSIRGWIRVLKQNQELKSLIKKYGDDKKVIYLSSPEHGNLGDQAIAIAIEEILKDSYKDSKYFEFSYNSYEILKDKLKEFIKDQDTLITQGGGNLGTLYLHEERQRRDIISRFPNNKIIIMPQSVSFAEGEEGEKELKKSREIYSKHKNLTILTRDEKSFDSAKKNFSKNKIFLIPDSVLYLEDYYKMKHSRDGIIFILRNDKEKFIKDEMKDKIISFLEEKKIGYSMNDTTIEKDVDYKTREAEVKKVLDKIAKSRLAITDRYHGLIFSVITKTPVIVFKSLDHKISEGIKWFKDYENVHYVDSIDEAKKLIEIYSTKVKVEERSEYLLKEKVREIFDMVK